MVCDDDGEHDGMADRYRRDLDDIDRILADVHAAPGSVMDVNEKDAYTSLAAGTVQLTAAMEAVSRKFYERDFAAAEFRLVYHYMWRRDHPVRARFSDLWKQLREEWNELRGWRAVKYNVVGTITGRFSCKGSNLSNEPRSAYDPPYEPTGRLGAVRTGVRRDGDGTVAEGRDRCDGERSRDEGGRPDRVPRRVRVGCGDPGGTAGSVSVDAPGCGPRPACHWAPGDGSCDAAMAEAEARALDCVFTGRVVRPGGEIRRESAIAPDGVDLAREGRGHVETGGAADARGRWHLASVGIEFEWRDLWIGAYVRSFGEYMMNRAGIRWEAGEKIQVFVCVVPCLPVVITLKRV